MLTIAGHLRRPAIVCGWAFKKSALVDFSMARCL